MIGWLALSRPVAVVAVGAALTTAATLVPGTVRIGEASAAEGTALASEVPVRNATLTCPGPETEGITGVSAVAGLETTVWAAAAPQEALAGLVATPGEGALTVRGLPGGDQLATANARPAGLGAAVRGASTAEVTATGSLAAGIAALQTGLRRQGDDRGLVAAACAEARSDMWLLGGGGDSTRRERLVVVNPGANPVTVDVQVHGDTGPVASVNGARLAVPGHGRIAVLVDALAAGQKTPALRVTATGGVVTAVLEDSWIEGATGRGRDDSGPTEPPSVEQVIPAAYLDGPARLRIVVPGEAEAVVQSRVLTTSGPASLPGDGVVRVPGGTVRDLDLGSLPAGAYAVQVRSDQPAAAAVMAERRSAGGGPSDLAWVASTAPVPALSGTPVPPGATADLMLVGTADASAATVFTVGADGGVASRSVSLAADSVATADVSGARAVWVRHTEGTVRAGLALRVDDGEGPLFSLVGLGPATLTATDVPVREIRR